LCGAILGSIHPVRHPSKLLASEADGSSVMMAGEHTQDVQNATEDSDDGHEVFLGDGAGDRVLEDLQGASSDLPCCDVRGKAGIQSSA
jgi:hypothetical protein